MLIHGRGAAALALLAGALVPLAFAPFSLSPIILPALLLIFFQWSELPVRTAALRGYLFGLGMFGVGCSWVFVSMNQFGGMGWLASGALTLLFVAFLALFPALGGYLVGRFRDYFRSPLGVALWLATVWCGIEMLRGWLFTGFPWLNSGVSQLRWPLSGYAPVFGVYGLGWLLAFSVALLLMAMRQGKKAWPLAAGVVVIWGVGALLQQHSWVESAGEPLRVSVVQGNVAQEEKWLPENRYPTFELYTDLTRQHWDSDLVVWPETAMTAFMHQLEPVMEGFMEEARQHNTAIITGVPVWEFAAQRYYNGVAAFADQTSVYFKRHLVPFGEYIPFHDTFLGEAMAFMDIPMTSFSAGEHGQPPLMAAGVAVGASICFEIAFAEEMIDPLPEAKLLVNLSNDAWFEGSLAPFQHLQMAQQRALESGRWIVRATNTGISAVIDAQGVIRAASPHDQRYVITQQVQPLRGTTPYVRWGNLPVLLLLLVVAGWGYWRYKMMISKPVKD